MPGDGTQKSSRDRACFYSTAALKAEGPGLAVVSAPPLGPILGLGLGSGPAAWTDGSPEPSAGGCGSGRLLGTFIHCIDLFSPPIPQVYLLTASRAPFITTAQFLKQENFHEHTPVIRSTDLAQRLPITLVVFFMTNKQTNKSLAGFLVQPSSQSGAGLSRLGSGSLEPRVCLSF